jgi:hypothetical protein
MPLVSLARVVCFVALVTVVAVACSRADSPPKDYQQAAVPAQPVPLTFTAADFKKLAWIEGAWRGRMPTGAYFHELYHVIDDSTMVEAGYTDSTFRTKRDSATIALRGGVILDGPTAPWKATRLDSTMVEFQKPNSKSHFTWTRKSMDSWTAQIFSTDTAGVEHSIIYDMERVRPKTTPKPK